VGLTNTTNSTAQRVWRFTPRDPTSFMPKSTSYGDSPDMPGNISIPVSMHLYGETRPCALVFFGASFRAFCRLPSSDSPPPPPPLLPCCLISPSSDSPSFNFPVV
jgi:hypothetical protein